MKNFKLFTYLFLAVSIVSLVACQSGAPTQTPVAKTTQAPAAPTSAAPSASYQFDSDWDNRDIFRQGLISTEQAALDQLPGASVYHIDFQIPSDYSPLAGHQQIRYTNQEDKPLEEIYFQLFPNASGGKSTVSAVAVDGQSVEPVYEFKNSAVRIPLSAPLQPGKSVIIEMDFAVELAREMEGNYGLFGYFDDVLVLDEFYPVIPVYDDEGWNVQAPPPNADTSYFDASFYVVRVTAPADLTVVATGIETSRESKDDTQILVFAAGPARDFYLAASNRFTLISETLGETSINSYAFEEYAPGAELAMQISVDALKSFNQRFGDYPYTEYDIVSTPMLALGIEYPAISGITLRAYDPDEVISGLPSQVILESATAHEAGHQWFYNVVGSDQIDEPWLDEAVVQYITGLYYLDTYNQTASESYQDSWTARWDRVKRANIPVGMPAAAYQGNEYGAIVYGRGPLFIEAMAKTMGQETFDAFMRDYYQSHKWGIGTGMAFKELAEKHCQCDLTSLFEEWVYKN